MHAAIVEFDPLADAVGATAEDDHFAPVAGLGLAFAIARAPLVTAIEIGGARGEFGGAGVNPLVNRVQAKTVASGGHGGGGLADQRAQASV